MTGSNDEPRKPKISHEFAARLSQLRPGQKIRAIVILRTGKAAPASARRQSRKEREASIEAIRQSAEAALAEIDRILGGSDGKRLTPDVNALGSIAVETTASGITALAKSEHVEAILEDQPITSLPTFKAV